MTTTQARFSKEEIARRGDAIYDRTIRPVLEAGNKGKFVAIDVGSGDFEIDADDYTAVKRLRERHPSGQFWLMMAGHATAYRFAGAR